MTTPWTPSEVSASGQVFEFRLWAALIEQSRSLLHVFLPLSDRGIDALLHRLTDDAYVPIQAKGRSELDHSGQVRLVVWADSPTDDKALIVSGLEVEGGLGPTTMVVSERDFKRLALLSHDRERAVYGMSFGMRPRARSRWFPYLVPTERLVERLGITPANLTLAPAPQPRPMWRSDLGFLGEAKVTVLLAESGALNLFRPFPDLETSELAVLHLDSRRVLGIQVKTRSIDAAHPDATVSVLASSFRPSPTTYFTVLAWLREERRFHEECLFIPSHDFRGLAHPEDPAGHLKFDWRPLSKKEHRLDPYRRQLSDLSVDIQGELTAKLLPCLRGSTRRSRGMGPID
ncbi:MAG: hypothetical protein ABI334_07555 [Candidatus Dormiibacterota bacterium]